MATLLDEFKSITSALNEAGIEYAVCGGWAMAIHGLPRTTVDIDVMILGEDLDAAWGIAKKLGYDVEGLPLNFDPVEIRRISKIDTETKYLYIIDFLLVTEKLRSVWNEREIREWPGGKTSTVSRAGLIELKRMAGRAQDLLDIENLLGTDDEA